MKFIFFRLVIIFTLFSVIGCGDKRSSSPDNERGNGTSSNNDNNVGTDTTTPGRHHGSHEKPGSTGEQVHIFKYTGRLACGTGGLDLEEMESQLTSITVHNRFESKDGKAYSGECDTKIGEINVYVIDKVNLIKSEKRGFCECTLNSQQGICTPYNYASPPASGCN